MKGIRKEATKITGITNEMFIKYCDTHKIPSYKVETKQLVLSKFFKGKIIIKEGRLIDNE